MITTLAPNEVFVFGSNMSGFHGAGSAGFAMRGDARNTWRQDRAFCDIAYGRRDDRRGRWAVFGMGRGFQVGTHGRSYAIPTVERPGFQGCVDEDFITGELCRLVCFAQEHPDLRFLVVKLGANRSEGGFSYLGLDAMRRCFDSVRWIFQRDGGIPPNIVLPPEFL